MYCVPKYQVSLTFGTPGVHIRAHARIHTRHFLCIPVGTQAPTPSQGFSVWGPILKKGRNVTTGTNRLRVGAGLTACHSQFNTFKVEPVTMRETDNRKTNNFFSIMMLQRSEVAVVTAHMDVLQEAVLKYNHTRQLVHPSYSTSTGKVCNRHNSWLGCQHHVAQLHVILSVHVPTLLSKAGSFKLWLPVWPAFNFAFNWNFNQEI